MPPASPLPLGGLPTWPVRRRPCARGVTLTLRTPGSHRLFHSASSRRPVPRPINTPAAVWSSSIPRPMPRNMQAAMSIIFLPLGATLCPSVAAFGRLASELGTRRGRRYRNTNVHVQGRDSYVAGRPGR